MIFKKEELMFLKMYSMLGDSESILNDKLNIKFDKENNEVVFSQLSYKFNLITRIQKNLDSITDSFEVIFETEQFFQLINSLPAESEMDLYDKGIKFNDSNYSFLTYDGDYSIINDIKDLKYNKEFTIKELDKMLLLKNFHGQKSLDAVFLLDGKFCASDWENISGIINTENNKSISLFLPSDFIFIVSLYKLNSVTFYEGDNFTYFKVGDTNIIVNELKYDDDLKDILSDDFKKQYYHENKVIIKKDELLESLKRISILAKDNQYSRIFISFSESNIKMESTDISYSLESIPFISIDDEIKDVNKLIVSSNNLKTIVSSLKGENVELRVSTEKNSVAITIEDEIKDKFFIQILHEEVL